MSHDSIANRLRDFAGIGCRWHWASTLPCQSMIVKWYVRRRTFPWGGGVRGYNHPRGSFTVQHWRRCFAFPVQYWSRTVQFCTVANCLLGNGVLERTDKWAVCTNTLPVISLARYSSYILTNMKFIEYTDRCRSVTEFSIIGMFKMSEVYGSIWKVHKRYTEGMEGTGRYGR